MKVKFTDGKFDSWFNLELETVAEVAAMVRTCKNAKKEPLDMDITFHDDGSVSVFITIRKKRPSNQVNRISTL